MKAKTFIPNELRNVSQKIESMRELSSSYFKVACELRDKACSERECIVPHCYVFPAVIMYVSSLEAYFNENLTLSSFRMDDEVLKEEVDKIKAGSGEYKTFGNRVKEIFKLYDKNNKGIDTSDLIFEIGLNVDLVLDVIGELMEEGIIEASDVQSSSRREGQS